MCRLFCQDTKNAYGAAPALQHASSDRGTVGGVKPRSEATDDFVLEGGSRVAAAVPSHTAAATASAANTTVANATAATADAATAHDRLPATSSATSPVVEAPAVATAATDAVPPSLPSPLILYGERRAIAIPFQDKMKEVGAEFMLTLCSAMLGKSPTAHVRDDNTMDDRECGRVHELITQPMLTPAISAMTDGCGCAVKVTKKVRR